MTATIHIGDCRITLGQMAENSVDSVVCDPPYHLTSIVKRFGKEGSAPCKVGATGAYARASRGFMGQEWDGGDVAFRPETWAEVMRVLKPGGHLVAFSGTRTYHRLACAVEDAGFEIRDMISWLYGSGFPKSHDISKAIDKAAGKLAAQAKGFNAAGLGAGYESNGGSKFRSDHPDFKPYSPATEEAAAWQGWGTALKPACEPIVLARKPLGEKNIAANVLAHGTGAINVDGCRIEAEGRPAREATGAGHDVAANINIGSGRAIGTTDLGRWPANVCHDDSDEVAAGFPDVAGAIGMRQHASGTNEVYGAFNHTDHSTGHQGVRDSGSAARFFYSAKADSDERHRGVPVTTDAAGKERRNHHPTVKPVDLMRWLVRLVTPPAGTVLDPFMGSGSTGIACQREGFRFIGCELSPEYAAIAEARLREDAGLFAAINVVTAAKDAAA